MSAVEQEYAVCAMVGCENKVPRLEWPADRDLPKICDAHLRQMQSRPSPERIDPMERSF